jgi:adenylate cyclase
MGSDQRFDYSVLGDPVNLAARLEGQSKNYGVGIVIGEGTRLLAPEYASIELDLIAVKGKVEAVRIFALLGDQTIAESAVCKAVIAAHSAMLEAYRSQHWEQAKDLVAKTRELGAQYKLDVLCDLYDERIDAYMESPPTADWNGVFIATSK